MLKRKKNEDKRFLHSLEGIGYYFVASMVRTILVYIISSLELPFQPKIIIRVLKLHILSELSLWASD